MLEALLAFIILVILFVQHPCNSFCAPRTQGGYRYLLRESRILLIHVFLIFNSAASQIENATVVRLPLMSETNPRPDYQPLVIPEDLAPRLLAMHDDPCVWWIGQFMKYLTRHQPQFQETIDKFKTASDVIGPIVG